MKKTRKFLGGLIEVNSNILMDDYNSSKVSDDEKYFMDMSVHAAAYTANQIHDNQRSDESANKSADAKNLQKPEISKMRC